ncbi:MAG: carboxymuconolactone decarboxylase family protein [Alphaproteobacteria bacterium]
MPFFDFLDEESGVHRIADYHGAGFDHIDQFTEDVMRGPSSLSVAERELIAAFVSGLNACQFCHGVHSHTAAAYGVDLGLFDDLIADIDSAAVTPQLKPVLHYVRKLTQSPSRMTQADAQAVFDAGWDERALHDAVLVCAMFNFYNRLIEGHGVKGYDALFKDRGPRLQRSGYLRETQAKPGD